MHGAWDGGEGAERRARWLKQRSNVVEPRWDMSLYENWANHHITEVLKVL